MSAEDDHDVALDALPETPDEKEPRWREYRGEMPTHCPPSSACSECPPADPEVAVVTALKSAAIRLRDAELEVRAAQKHYGEALQAFNKFVAPVPSTGG